MTSTTVDRYFGYRDASSVTRRCAPQMRTLAQRALLFIFTVVISTAFLYTGDNDGITRERTRRIPRAHIRHQRSRFAHARERVRLRPPWNAAATATPAPSPAVSAPPEEDDENGRNRNDLVTKFLRMVETQHVLGENCTAGTDLILADGVVATYAQEKFRLEAEVAVNRANFLTRLWRYAPDALRKTEYILYAGVRSMIDLHDDIFGAGNCYDKGAFKEGLFCPFAYRHPDGTVIAKDLSIEYKYLANTSEWFYRARASAHRVISHLPKALRTGECSRGNRRVIWCVGFNYFRSNESSHSPAQEEEILTVSYEDGWWTKPYFDCGGGNIWMMTYTVPFFGFVNGSFVFKGTSGIDIDLRRVDIDQCPPGANAPELNVFAYTDKCKSRTTRCVALPGLGFRRGSYKCVCRDGFYHPNAFFSGIQLEEEYEKLLQKQDNLYEDEGQFECHVCADGCETCVDDRPCVASLNWALRSSILALNSLVMGALPIITIFTCKYGEVKVVKAASPLLLRVIIVGAVLLYSTIIVMYFPPTTVTCTARVWLREIGFVLSYGALLLKTWRISLIFRVRSAKAIKITDWDLIKGLSFLVGAFVIFLSIRTVVNTPHVIVGRTTDDLKAFLCSTDWWDHSFTVVEMLFLVWGIRLCIVVRKAPSEFNESKFISLSIYNEFLLSSFLNVSMLFLQSPANPDLMYIIFFCHSQLTTTLLLCLIFGSKAYLALKGRGKDDEGSSTTYVTKPLTAKFLIRPKSLNSTQRVLSSPSVTAPSEPITVILTEADAQDELDAICAQLESLKEKNERLGFDRLVITIDAMQDAFKSRSATQTVIQRHIGVDTRTLASDSSASIAECCSSTSARELDVVSVGKETDRDKEVPSTND